MVAKVNPGKNIRGIINYNENKVKKGCATCIDAVGFGLEPSDLSFHEKLNRFTGLTSRNSITKTNAVHISLNFDPTEKLSKETLREIASAYMDKIGFGDQPYLLYEHTDAGHPHIHIATVNIREDGSRIDLHNIGMNQSSQARKEIEQEFGLIPAEGREEYQDRILDPAYLQKVIYGEKTTKSEISRIVRTVVSNYKFTSLAELNAILNPLNVIADPGHPGTKQFETGGLVYRLFDCNTGKDIGVPIKASSIYDKPTLKNLREQYKKNAVKRQKYKGRLIRTIDLCLARGLDKGSFTDQMKSEGIDVIFRTNPEGHIYGITYVDHSTYCVYNGSDLGKGYSAKAILDKLQPFNSADLIHHQNFVQGVLDQTNFNQPFRKVIADWAMAGMVVHAEPSGGDQLQYWLGSIHTSTNYFVRADKRIAAYLSANSLDDRITDRLITSLKPLLTADPQNNFVPLPSAGFTYSFRQQANSLIDIIFDSSGGYGYTPAELMREARKKRKRKRR